MFLKEFMEATKTLTEEQVDLVFKRIGKAKEGEVIFIFVLKTPIQVSKHGKNYYGTPEKCSTRILSIIFKQGSCWSVVNFRKLPMYLIKRIDNERNT